MLRASVDTAQLTLGHVGSPNSGSSKSASSSAGVRTRYDSDLMLGPNSLKASVYFHVGMSLYGCVGPWMTRSTV